MQLGIQCLRIDPLFPGFFVWLCFRPEIGALEEMRSSGLYSASDECITRNFRHHLFLCVPPVAVAVFVNYSCIFAAGNISLNVHLVAKTRGIQ